MSSAWRFPNTRPCAGAGGVLVERINGHVVGVLAFRVFHIGDEVGLARGGSLVARAHEELAVARAGKCHHAVHGAVFHDELGVHNPEHVRAGIYGDWIGAVGHLVGGNGGSACALGRIGRLFGLFLGIGIACLCADDPYLL